MFQKVFKRIWQKITWYAKVVLIIVYSCHQWVLRFEGTKITLNFFHLSISFGNMQHNQRILLNWWKENRKVSKKEKNHRKKEENNNKTIGFYIWLPKYIHHCSKNAKMVNNKYEIKSNNAALIWKTKQKQKQAGYWCSWRLK